MGKPKIRFKGFTEDWEQRKLGETLYSLRNNTLSRAELSLENGVAKNVHYGDILVKFGEILDVKKELLPMIVDELVLAKYRDSFLQNGDIVIADTAEDETVGKCSEIEGVSDEKIIAGLHTIPCRPLFNFASGYLGYYLNSDDYHRQLLPLMQGIKVTSISKSALQDTKIQYPKSLEEQEQIGTYFRWFDYLITLHQRKCDETKKLKKYMLQKMFPQNGMKVPEIRFKGFTSDWEQRKLSELIVEYKETVEADCELPVLTSSKTEGVLLQEEHFGRKQSHDITGYNVLPRNYCTYRNRSDGIDFTFNINKCCDKGIISKFYPVFCGKDNDTFFISLVLNNSNEVVREIGYTCTGTGQKVLSFSDLIKMYLRVPNYEEQKKIAVYFDSLDHLITLHQRKRDELVKIKEYMLQNMFV